MGKAHRKREAEEVSSSCCLRHLLASLGGFDRLPELSGLQLPLLKNGNNDNTPFRVRSEIRVSKPVESSTNLGATIITEFSNLQSPFAKS